MIHACHKDTVALVGFPVTHSGILHVQFMDTYAQHYFMFHSCLLGLQPPALPPIFLQSLVISGSLTVLVIHCLWSLIPYFEKCLLTVARCLLLCFPETVLTSFFFHMWQQHLFAELQSVRKILIVFPCTSNRINIIFTFPSK